MALDLTLIGKPSEPSVYSYTWRDVVLYALGVGAKREELEYLYEGLGPKVLPGFAVVPKFASLLAHLGKSGGNMAMVVHGGEKVVVHKPFAPEGTLTTTATVRAVYDLRRLASVVIDADSVDAHGERIATTTSTIFFRGEGGFGGDPPPKVSTGMEVPKGRDPDFRVEEATTPEQALLYRLSGDLNPLHADPRFAEAVGFSQGPILHGLCTFGHMARHVAKAACGGDSSRVTGFEANFRKPVWPGDTLVTQGWHVGPGKIALQVLVKERDEAVITGAWATVRE